MTNNADRKISSLRDLPLDIAPPRDLWRGIEAQIAAEPRAGKRFARAARMRFLAAAAVIAALAVGIWIGRAVLPGAGPASSGGQVASNSPATGANSGQPTVESGAIRPEFFMDAKYIRQRAQLVQGLEARIAALPPESRDKVVHSLKAISDSKRELEAELGKDPSNALLQELLVNTYQDEMRVLTAVHEAGSTAEGI